MVLTLSTNHKFIRAAVSQPERLSPLLTQANQINTETILDWTSQIPPVEAF